MEDQPQWTKEKNNHNVIHYMITVDPYDDPGCSSILCWKYDENGYMYILNCEPNVKIKTI